MDKNKDMRLDKKELSTWMLYIRNMAMERDTKREWKIHNTKNSKEINWSDYQNAKHPNVNKTLEMQKFEKSDLIKNLRRWKLADQNGDGNLTYNEFKDFLFPDVNIGFKSLYILENVLNYDRNADSVISLHEYVEFRFKKPYSDVSETDRVEGIRVFKTLDFDGDGIINFFEQTHMFHICTKNNPIDMLLRAEHFIKVYDRNSDGILTRQEVLSNYTKTALSELTDRGNYLIHYDEL